MRYSTPCATSIIQSSREGSYYYYCYYYPQLCSSEAKEWPWAKQLPSGINLLRGIMLSQCVRTHADHANCFSSLPLLKSPQKRGGLFPFYHHHVSTAVCSGMFAAAVWKISLLLFNVLNFLTAASILYTLPHLHLLCYKLGRDCEKLRQWRQIGIKWKMLCLVHRENSIFNVKPCATATTAELHQYLRAGFRSAVSGSTPETSWRGPGALVRVMTQRWMWKVTSRH